MCQVQCAAFHAVTLPAPTYGDVLRAAGVHRIVEHGQAALVAVHVPAQHLHMTGMPGDGRLTS